MLALAQNSPITEFDQVDQPLFMVMGGEIRDPRGAEFIDMNALDIRGIFPTYEEAFTVWRGAAQATVDRAFTKYMIIRLR